MTKKLAIIGASYLQKPLVQKANELDVETHVFAWKDGCVVEEVADYFYPISILETDQILKKCREIGIDGVISIGSDIAMPTVNTIANQLRLTGHSPETTLLTTNKYLMRKELSEAGIPCPKFGLYRSAEFYDSIRYSFPAIVKPTDRSGSLGVTKVEKPEDVSTALKTALSLSLSRSAIVEEFINGSEFSVEGLSFSGKHKVLAITEKETTGPPHFVEMAHHQPAQISSNIENKIVKITKDALQILGVRDGASHTEVILDSDENVFIVEVSGRMGGDLIGSHLVPLSTGFDYLKSVIEIALNDYDPEKEFRKSSDYSGVYYVMPGPGIVREIEDLSSQFDEIMNVIPILNFGDKIDARMDCSGKRAGAVVYKSADGKVELNPADVLKFKITKNRCA